MTPNRIFIKDQSAIPLGMQGDGNVREIVFSPPDELAGKTWTASHQRATDPEPYPVALRADEDKLIWLVSAADTDVAGQGRFQLVCLDGDDQVLKTMVYRTHVSASLSTPGDVPDPVKPWYDALMRELADIGDIPPEEIEQAVRDYLTEHPFAETDPTVPDWAKQPEKPTYTAEDVGALAQDALQDAIDQALAQAKNSGEFDGEKGSPGKDGITPHIGGNGNWYLGDNDTGKPSRGDPGTPGKNGVDGTSVTVQTVAESTEDGGENVVTFSDGKTLTVKNGKKGANGVDGHTPIRGTDYYTEADKREIVDDVLEQMPSGGGDVTLGIAGAMVGQIAKITAVDADGKPTAWEPVDMTGGGGDLRHIGTITIGDNIDAWAAYGIDADSDGNPFSLRTVRLVFENEFAAPSGYIMIGANGNKGWERLLTYTIKDLRYIEFSVFDNLLWITGAGGMTYGRFGQSLNGKTTIQSISIESSAGWVAAGGKCEVYGE